MRKLVIGVVLLQLLSACASNKPVEPVATNKVVAPEVAPQPVAPEPVINPAPAPDVNAQSLPKVESDPSTKAAVSEAAEVAAKTENAAKADPLNDPSGPLAKRNVHFPFDVDAIQESDKLVIQAHGAYLADHPERKVRTEGNADERGSAEYNLALGQRRANNTRKALVLSGAKAEQIEAISYGEEKPVATGHDEASWAENRRADINYK